VAIEDRARLDTPTRAPDTAEGSARHSESSAGHSEGSAGAGQVLASGPGEEFAAMYERHYPRLVRALELGGLDRPSAEDTAQEAFARTLSHWWRVRKGSNPPGYVYRTAFRLSWRRPREHRPLTEDAHLTEDIAGEAIVNVTITEVLAAMPARRRACVVACLVVGLTPKEAGRALGIADSTVRKQLERGRLDLARALQQ